MGARFNAISLPVLPLQTVKIVTGSSLCQPEWLAVVLEAHKKVLLSRKLIFVSVCSLLQINFRSTSDQLQELVIYLKHWAMKKGWQSLFFVNELTSRLQK